MAATNKGLRSASRHLQQQGRASPVVILDSLWQRHAPQLLDGLWRRQAALRGRQRRLRAALAPLRAGKPRDLRQRGARWARGAVCGRCRQARARIRPSRRRARATQPNAKSAARLACVRPSAIAAAARRNDECLDSAAALRCRHSEAGEAGGVHASAPRSLQQPAATTSRQGSMSSRHSSEGTSAPAGQH